MRAVLPDRQDHVEVDRVRIGWESYGDGAPTFLLLPTWTIVHSRIWKAQVPFLARRHRVVVYDGPGNGRSDRTTDPAPYEMEHAVATAAAVLDASDTDAAIVVSLSKGAPRSLALGAVHPRRVLGHVFIAPTLNLSPQHPARASIADTFLTEIANPTGWEKYNAVHWRRDLQDFAEFFFAEALPEPHSTKQREDVVSWALETDGEVLLAEAVGAGDGPDRNQVLAWCEANEAPVLVIHGDDDRISPPSRGDALAAATGGELVVLEGCGHLPLARDPVKVNRLLADFADRIRR